MFGNNNNSKTRTRTKTQTKPQTKPQILTVPFGSGSEFGFGFGSDSRSPPQTEHQTQTNPFSGCLFGQLHPFGSTSQTQTNHFTGSSNILGSTTTTKTNTSTNSNRNSSTNDIMFAVLTSNFQEVIRLVNSSNVNDIIDTINNYTSLHHAVRIKGNNSIIEYLMSIGGDPKIKQSEGKDCIDLAIEANYRYLIDKLLKEKDVELHKIYDKFDTINYEYKNLQTANDVLIEENEYLKKSSSLYVEKIKLLKTENVELKRKFDESEKSFANLLKKIKK